MKREPDCILAYGKKEAGRMLFRRRWTVAAFWADL